MSSEVIEKAGLSVLPPMPPEKRPRVRRWLVVLLAASMAGGAGWYWRQEAWQWYQQRQVASDPGATMRFAQVQRGELRIVVTEEGKIRTVNSTKIFPSFRGAGKITWLIAEGSSVKAGDLLATFDSKPTDDQLRQRRTELENAQRALTIAEEGLNIQRKTGEATVIQARGKVDEAEVALKVYRDMEAPKRLAEIDANINEAKNKLAEARKQLAESAGRVESETTVEENQRRLLERELQERRDAVAAIQKRLDAANLDRKAFRAYTYPQTLTAREQADEMARLALERSVVEARSQQLQKEAEVARARNAIVAHQNEIEVLEKQLSGLQVKAPIDGFVVYGDSAQPAWYGRGQPIAVGADWYAQNVLMTIPDAREFEVGVGIPETVRGWLKEECSASITFSAVPGLVIEGKLKSIQRVARQGNYFDAGGNVFDAVVSMPQTDPRLVTGMSARVEMLAESVADALQVPIEAVANEHGQTVCYVKTATSTERRVVKTGRSSLHHVQILEGLSEGEEVSLTPQRSVGSANKTEKAPPSAEVGS